MSIVIYQNDGRFKAVKFLVSCMIKNGLRFHMKHFKVEEDNSAVATDGGRIHFVKEIPLGPGYYEVHKNNKTSILLERAYPLDTNQGRFPNYLGLLDPVKGSTEFDLDCLNDNESMTIAYTKVIRVMSETTINFRFIEDICKTLDDIVHCIIPPPEKGETNKPVYFISGDFYAIVMPMGL